MFTNYFVKHQIDSYEETAVSTLEHVWCRAFFFAVILCCTKHLSLISLILILGQMKIEELPWLLLSEKQGRTQLSFFWISQKPWEENPFRFETLGLYQRPPHRYMVLSNQQEPRSPPHSIHQEVMFQQPLLRSPLRATTLMVPTHRAVTGFTTGSFMWNCGSENWRENKIQEWPEISCGWRMLTLSRRCTADNVL